MDNLAQTLNWSNEGSELFLRLVDLMPDQEFAAPSLLPLWTKAEVVAHVAFNADAIGNLVTWATTGVETPMYATLTARAAQMAASLLYSVDELRELVKSSHAHLALKFATLNESSWNSQVTTAQGRVVPATELPWMRTREVWVHSIDLDCGVGFRSFPDGLVDALLNNMAAHRGDRENHPSLLLVPNDRSQTWNIGPSTSTTIEVRGASSDIACWLAGRGIEGIEIEGGVPPEIGPWF